MAYLESELASPVIDSRPESPDSTTLNAVEAARRAKKERDGMAEKLAAAESRIRKLQKSSGSGGSDGRFDAGGGGGGGAGGGGGRGGAGDDGDFYGDVGTGPASTTSNMGPTGGLAAALSIAVDHMAGSDLSRDTLIYFTHLYVCN